MSRKNTVAQATQEEDDASSESDNEDDHEDGADDSQDGDSDMEEQHVAASPVTRSQGKGKQKQQPGHAPSNSQKKRRRNRQGGMDPDFFLLDSYSGRVVCCSEFTSVRVALTYR